MFSLIFSLLVLRLSSAPVRTCGEQQECLSMSTTYEPEEDRLTLCLYFDGSDTCSKDSTETISYACYDQLEENKIEGFAEGSSNAMCIIRDCEAVRGLPDAERYVEFGVKDGRGCSNANEQELDGFTDECRPATEGDVFCGGGQNRECIHRIFYSCPPKTTECNSDCTRNGLSGSWTTLTPSPVSNEGAFGAVFDDELYFTSGAGFQLSVLRYHIVADLWLNTMVPPTPHWTTESTSVQIGANWWLLGHSSISDGSQNEMIHYNVNSNMWSYDGNIPWNVGVHRRGFAAAAWKEFIYVFGGREGSGGLCSNNPQTDAHRYSTLTAVWDDIPILNYPYLVSDHSAQTIGDKIYIIGGCSGPFTFFDKTVIYDPISNTYSDGAPMPTPRSSYYYIASIGCMIYVIGGWNGVSGVALDTVEAYDTVNDIWYSNLQTMPTARAELVSLSHNNKIYVTTGGTPGFGFHSPANEVFDPCGGMQLSWDVYRDQGGDDQGDGDGEFEAKSSVNDNNSPNMFGMKDAKDGEIYIILSVIIIAAIVVLIALICGGYQCVQKRKAFKELNGMEDQMRECDINIDNEKPLQQTDVVDDNIAHTAD